MQPSLAVCVIRMLSSDGMLLMIQIQYLSFDQ
jgi:hypothetical protein